VDNIYTFLDIQHASYDEIMGVIFSIEYAQLKNFKKTLIRVRFFFILSSFLFSSYNFVDF